MDSKKIILAYKKVGARIGTTPRVVLKNMKKFSLFYTPGVASASEYLAKYPNKARSLSIKKNSVAIVSDGSAVLGLGNIGPYGALPVMEGKALIFKEFADIDAWPIVLDTQDPDEIVKTILAIAPGFGGINLEDIAAPKCFDIEKRLSQALDIPVMHDDQHGTAIVVLAGLINATKVVQKNIKKLRVVISGAGSAGTATAKLFLAAGIKDIILLDRSGSIYQGRKNLSPVKENLAQITNPRCISGGVREAIIDADVFIGLSGKGIISWNEVKTMAPKSIVFALANPTPEIMPEDAKKGGAYIVATGRSDFPNQINNALVFPGVFRGAFDSNVRNITITMKLRVAKALAGLIKKPTTTNIVPTIFDTRVVKTVAKAVH